MPVASSERPLVLVTGASSGLGLAIARALAEPPRRWRLLLTARTESMRRFQSAGLSDGVETILRPLDVADPVQRRALAEEAESRLGGIHAIINNAGVAYRAVVEHWDDAAWDESMTVNVRAPMDLARLALPGMRARRFGRIINISSVGGLMAMPAMSLYSAAKFALEGASEALWYEVRPWNVRVTLVEPGFIASDSFRNTRFTARGFAAALHEEDPYHHHYQKMAAFIERMMLRSIATPEKVAATVRRTLLSPKPPLRVYATPDAHVFAMLRRLLPRRLYHGVLYRSLPGIQHWGERGGAGKNSDSAGEQVGVA
jgi:NAD(P)-dependent dehydrogenase (short-subunit alcohol dehydrogenase family)